MTSDTESFLQWRRSQEEAIKKSVVFNMYLIIVHISWSNVLNAYSIDTSIYSRYYINFVERSLNVTTLSSYLILVCTLLHGME